jgi:hypothetical protein
MSFGRPPPRHPIQTKDAARNREEQRRFDLMTTTWNEAQLRRALRILKLPEVGRSVDQMQMDLVASQVHRLATDDMITDPATGSSVWPDPGGLFNQSF